MDNVAEVAYNLRKVVLVGNDLSRKRGLEIGLTGPQLSAIRVLSRTGPLMISELANLILLHPATTGGILDRLEAKGLILRRRSHTDRRIVRVHLTQQGKELLQNWAPVTQETLTSALRMLTDEKLQNLAEVLKDIMKTLETGENRSDITVSIDSAQASNTASNQ